MKFIVIFCSVFYIFSLGAFAQKRSTLPTHEAIAGGEYEVSSSETEPTYEQKSIFEENKKKIIPQKRPISKNNLYKKNTSTEPNTPPQKIKKPSFIKKAIAYQKNAQDTIVAQKKTSFWSKLGCFVKRPTELISIASTLFPLTKPPTESAFMILLYVIYIIPLILIITTLVIGGVVGFFLMSAFLGSLSFLLYWGILALFGTALTGGFLLGGIIGAMILGIVFYFMVSALCGKKA